MALSSQIESFENLLLFVTLVTKSDRISNGYGSVRTTEIKTEDMNYVMYAIIPASKNRHVNVLDWWLKNTTDMAEAFKHGFCVKHALDYAMMDGHVDVLEWWRKSNIQYFIIDPGRYSYVIGVGHIDVLEWLKKYDTEFDERIRQIVNKYYLEPWAHDNSIKWLHKNGYFYVPNSSKILELYNGHDYSKIIDFFIKI